MSGENKLTTRIFAVAIITFGIIFGSTWNSIGFCLGEYIFLPLVFLFGQEERVESIIRE